MKGDPHPRPKQLQGRANIGTLPLHPGYNPRRKKFGDSWIEKNQHLGKRSNLIAMGLIEQQKKKFALRQN